MNPVLHLDDLPYTLNASHVAAVLGVSRGAAYALLHSEGFPTVHVGKRLLVTRDRFADWLEKQSN